MSVSANQEVLSMLMDLHVRINKIMAVFEGNAELAFDEGDMQQSLGCAAASGISSCIAGLINGLTAQFAKEVNNGQGKSTIEG